MLHELAFDDQVIAGRQVVVQQIVDAFEQHGQRYDYAGAFNDRYGTTLAYRGRYELVPLATDVARFRPSSKPAARASFDLPLDAFVLL